MSSLADEIINENVDNIRQILHSGVDVNQTDEYGFTFLVEAAIADNIEIARLLLQAGADVNLQDMTGGTALHWATENNNLAFCKLLLECGANPNAYSFAGVPILVMPLLRRHKQVKDLLLQHGAELSFAQDFINTKLLGHMFELVGTANIVDPKNNFVELDFEGFFLEFSVGIIGDSLSQFKNHFAARHLRRYAEIAQIIINSMQNASKLVQFQQYRVNVESHRSEIAGLIAQEPLLIPIGYEGHAITFVKLGNILAKCDRREDSRLYDNIMFYHINRPENFSPEFIKDFIYEKKSDHFVNTVLPELLDLQPITELKVPAQISGNCSWANVEAVIPTIFFLVVMASSQDEKNIPNYKSVALNYFNQWLNWNKNRSLQFCIQSFKDGNTIRNACKAEILAAVLFQRFRENNTADHDRIESILAILSLPQYRHILDNYIKTYCYESLSEEGKQFSALLKQYGYI